MNIILVIAAHPDDEVLGCGGTITKLVQQGVNVHVTFLADGVFSRAGDVKARQAALEARRAAALSAGKIMGVNTISFGDFPDNRMDTVALLDVTQHIESLVQKHQPDTILTHHAGDLNIDHRITHESVITACRPQQGHSVKTLLCFEVPSSTEWQLPSSAQAFSPNWFVDISSTLEHKLAALEAYTNELRQWPHPRSKKGVECLAHWRGATVGVEAAEAFLLGRQLV